MKLNLSGTCTLIILFTMTKVWAQLPDTLWTRIYPQFDDSCNYFGAITGTSDSGIAIAGYFCNSPNNGVVLKCNDMGNPEWLWVSQRVESDGFLDAVATPDNGVIAVGYPASTYGLIATKFDQAGDTSWTFLLAQGDRRSNVIQTAQGDFVIAGLVNQPIEGPWPGLIKLTPDGHIDFIRNYPHFWQRNTYVHGMAEAWDHGFIIACSATRVLRPLQYSAYIIRTNASGDTLWTRTWPLLSNDSLDYPPTAICRADSGNYFIAVKTRDYRTDIFRSLLVKLTNTGDTLWSREYEFPNYILEAVDQLLPDPRGGILVSLTAYNINWAQNEAFLFKITTHGDVLWAGSFASLTGWDCQVKDLAIAADGTYLWLLFDAYRARVVRMEGDSQTNEPPTPLKPLPLIYLQQNYPNPFNSTTTISFSLMRKMRIRLAVFDLLGREVTSLLNGESEYGDHQIIFDAAGLASGVYLCRIEAGEFAQTRKMVLLK